MDPFQQPAQEQPVALIQVALFADGRVAFGGNIPANELLVRGLLEKAKELILAEMLKPRRAIEVPHPGLVGALNGTNRKG